MLQAANRVGSRPRWNLPERSCHGRPFSYLGGCVNGYQADFVEGVERSHLDTQSGRALTHCGVRDHGGDNDGVRWLDDEGMRVGAGRIGS